MVKKFIWLKTLCSKHTLTKSDTIKYNLTKKNLHTAVYSSDK